MDDNGTDLQSDLRAALDHTKAALVASGAIGGGLYALRGTIGDVWLTLDRKKPVAFVTIALLVVLYTLGIYLLAFGWFRSRRGMKFADEYRARKEQEVKQLLKAAGDWQRDWDDDAELAALDGRGERKVSGRIRRIARETSGRRPSLRVDVEIVNGTGGRLLIQGLRVHYIKDRGSNQTAMVYTLPIQPYEWEIETDGAYEPPTEAGFELHHDLSVAVRASPSSPASTTSPTPR